MKLIALYLILINLTGFFAMLSDKRRAIRHKWRIPEKTLMLLAALGGSIGSLAGMYTFRHKTKHPKFYVGIPVLLVCQVLLAGVLAWNLVR